MTIILNEEAKTTRAVEVQKIAIIHNGDVLWHEFTPVLLKAGDIAHLKITLRNVDGDLCIT
jgi:hypothetical protein